MPPLMPWLPPLPQTDQIDHTCKMLSARRAAKVGTSPAALSAASIFMLASELAVIEADERTSAASAA